MKREQSCSTCQFFRRNVSSLDGMYTFSGECAAPLPVSISASGLFAKIKRAHMGAADGTTCPAHRKRIVRVKTNEGVTP